MAVHHHRRHCPRHYRHVISIIVLKQTYERDAEASTKDAEDGVFVENSNVAEQRQLQTPRHSVTGNGTDQRLKGD